MVDNLSRQVDEIEALSSIYEKEWKTEDEANRSYSIKVGEGEQYVILYTKLPEDYPSQSPPVFQLSAPSLSNQHKMQINAELQAVYLQVLDKLYEEKTIEKATHNIYAYRILKEDTKSFIHDSEDDGETQAGARVMHLLEILNVQNVLVVVTRWYGGTHLGPDRFRHINNSARQVLDKAGFIPVPGQQHIKKKK